MGGQSIPKFDYDLAPFVTKSFIINICEYLEDNEISDKDIKTIKDKLKEYSKTNKSLMTSSSLEYIKDFIYKTIKDTSLVERCINKALERTDRDTYQAMEALIHNLNTMQSRAGSQVGTT